MNRLKAALIGLTGVGAAYLDALRTDDQFELVAVGDAEREVLRRTAGDLTARAFEDHRSLIVESARDGLDVLFVAAEPFQSREFVELALSRGVAVFHKTPPARNREEGLRLADAADRAHVPLLVEPGYAFDPALSRLRSLPGSLGPILSVQANVRVADEPTGWRAETARSGGGVLLNAAYPLLDLIVSVCGPARSVFARCGRGAFPELSAKYDTEDVAQVSLILSNGAIGDVTAVRGAPGSGWAVNFDGPRASATISERELRITPRGGADREEVVPISHRNRAAAAISAFGAATLAGVQAVPSTIRDHLPTLAVIDAAYLSAKTGVPESPGE